jgi:hypothetical protein
LNGLNSIVSDYGLAIGVRSPAEAAYFSSVLTGSGSHPAFYPVGSGASLPGGKARPGYNAEHLLHLVPRSRMSRSYTSSPPDASMACSGTALLLFLLLNFRTLYSRRQHFDAFFIFINVFRGKVNWHYIMDTVVFVCLQGNMTTFCFQREQFAKT